MYIGALYRQAPLWTQVQELKAKRLSLLYMQCLLEPTKLREGGRNSLTGIQRRTNGSAAGARGWGGSDERKHGGTGTRAQELVQRLDRSDGGREPRDWIGEEGAGVRVVDRSRGEHKQAGSTGEEEAHSRAHSPPEPGTEEES